MKTASFDEELLDLCAELRRDQIRQEADEQAAEEQKLASLSGESIGSLLDNVVSNQIQEVISAREKTAQQMIDEHIVRGQLKKLAAERKTLLNVFKG